MWGLGIKTRFVRDRLRETRWEDREYIGKLMSIERVILNPKVRQGWLQAMAYAGLRAEFPVEYEAIEAELQRGVYTTPDEFRKRLAARHARMMQDERNERDRQESEEAREREEWLKAGGRP